ncbi:replication-associated recombination protein A [Catalinimonas niigatensis]|uniref:replication-associated recombination protein A n=1 Tax=Catalinimonas niigatensis TaxID=1397264 RepID=UPI0026671B3F|nr:replication-associated recombination protein A [Catalinimonas niigatensis]WPP53725.1 replication-associated recombination protein A [Catalinimonas niigatensis]
MSLQPLAEILRPKTLDEVTGQQHLAGAQGVLRKMLEGSRLPSIIFWGPPGVGKTTLAQILAHESKAQIFFLSAINAGVKEVRDVINRAQGLIQTILFIDEIHRFNKSQQDALLGAVEKGQITLIGATTENPSFEVNAALLSRCQVYHLNPLSKQELRELIHKVENHPTLGKEIHVKEYEALFRLSGGDARRLLNLLELIIRQSGDKVDIDNDLVTKLAQQKVALYDKAGEQHYDIISAFIKSIRGSDPNAAVYYLARMIEGGEDAKFIARRLLILASEDIGNANPTALVLATNCFQAVSFIGYPEAEIILSQCVTYLASSPKSNASYAAIKQAKALVKNTGDLAVPMHIRNAPTRLMQDEGYGKGYKYAHNYDGNFVSQEFLPEEIKNTKFYEPGDNPRENELRKRLKAYWKEKYGY